MNMMQMQNFGGVLNNNFPQMLNNQIQYDPMQEMDIQTEVLNITKIKECDNANEEDLQFLNKNSDSPNHHIHPKKNSKLHFHNRHVSHPIIKINKFIINKHNN